MTARGIRNNNPGNLRHGCKWQGMVTEQTDADFIQFQGMTWGCRALLKTLRTYHEKLGLTTVEAIINRWAPPCENNTDSYAHHVAERLGVTPSDPLTFTIGTYINLAKAIALHENGADALSIDESTWQEAAQLAGLRDDRSY